MMIYAYRRDQTSGNLRRRRGPDLRQYLDFLRHIRESRGVAKRTVPAPAP